MTIKNDWKVWIIERPTRTSKNRSHHSILMWKCDPWSWLFPKWNCMAATTFRSSVIQSNKCFAACTPPGMERPLQLQQCDAVEGELPHKRRHNMSGGSTTLTANSTWPAHSFSTAEEWKTFLSPFKNKRMPSLFKATSSYICLVGWWQPLLSAGISREKQNRNFVAWLYFSNTVLLPSSNV